MSQDGPQIIFGTASIGYGSLAEEDAIQQFLQVASDNGVKQLDTAASYPTEEATGQTEVLLGKVKSSEQDWLIDTRVAISRNLLGCLAPDAIEKSLNTSLERLHQNSVNILSAHMPDPGTSLEDQARGFDEQFQKGKFKKLGLCNWPLSMIEKYIEICDAKGYVKPSVAQYMYNYIWRGTGTKILEFLRKHNIALHAYSPLAGGFLTGKPTSGDTAGTRYGEPTHPLTIYKFIYDKEPFHKAVKDLYGLIKDGEVESTSDVAIRWLYYHSKLESQDAIILGGSKVEHFEKNVAAVKKGPLPEKVLKALEGLEVSEAGMGDGNVFGSVFEQ
ncbi:hypothetical protein FPOAC2_01943 [Fusarium poae]|uniref:hypothetical protein n=1 Tax=Fusarium poae TaxID=36050 RepID=UPI001CE74514|nr:hypothetical protein FPOAC1_001857 [Fusarium poae]KAG8675862.1 hypothetical protein FPOAC1_001857 [Fusarium poae]